ncbi:MAG: hypothetical protein LBP32_08415 [Spirochaetaceae bacterium]|jgi:hypothetical protein|nr:hypothetical protein [Spirochaetaceae bacterium]
MSRYKLKNITILACGICFALLPVLSVDFISSRADHDCSGRDCPVCVQIQGARNFLRQLGSAAVPLPAFVWFFVPLALMVPVLLFPPTSVFLKVRLNN